MRLTRGSPISVPIALALLGGCLDADRSRSVEPRRQELRLVMLDVVAAEGAVLAETGDAPLHPGARLVVPPGALAADARVTLSVRYGDPRLPSIVQTFRIDTGGVALRSGVELTIEYSASYEAAADKVFDEDRIDVFGLTDGAPRWFEPTSRDAAANTVTAVIDAPGTFFAADATFVELLSGEAALLDPATPLRAARAHGRLLEAENGANVVHVGVGSLAGFLAASAEHNLLVLPGTFVGPLELGDDPRLVHHRGLGFENIVVFRYPRARSIAAAANTLYDALAAGRGPGFGCRVLAHGTGGLVARYALERSHADPARPGFRAGDPPLSDFVPELVLVAVPNQGSTALAAAFAELLENVLDGDLPFVQGLVDVLPGSGSFTDRLNAGWHHPPGTRYLAIAGDADGRRSDGVVSVPSALGIPDPAGRPDGWLVFSGSVYDHANLLLEGDRNGVLAQVAAWFGRLPSNTPPIVASVRTPAGQQSAHVPVPFRLADAQSDPCLVRASFSLDGGRSWLQATPVSGAGGALHLASSDAPGSPQTWVWDSFTDGIRAGRPVAAMLRITAFDASGSGVPGQTGTFVILH